MYYKKRGSQNLEKNVVLRMKGNEISDLTVQGPRR